MSPLYYWEGQCDRCGRKLMHRSFWVNADGSVFCLTCHRKEKHPGNRFNWEKAYYRIEEWLRPPPEPDYR